MLKKVLFLFSCSAVVWGQNVDFEGYVLSEKENKPVPYVNLSFLNTLVGTSTDEEGHFILEVPEIFMEKMVHISSLGFKDTVISASAINRNKNVLLKEEMFELEEVQVVKELGDVQILNPVRSQEISSGFDVSSTPWVVALYFPNIGAAKKYIDRVSVFFRDNSTFKRDKSKFRLRIYDVDPATKLPKSDLIKENIIVESVKGQPFVTVDLDDYRIKMPRQGIYVGLEWLFIPFNWYPKKENNGLSNKPTMEDRFAPTFGGVYSNKANYRVVVYGMGQWQEFRVRSREGNSQLIPAITLRIKT